MCRSRLGLGLLLLASCTAGNEPAMPGVPGPAPRDARNATPADSSPHIDERPVPMSMSDAPSITDVVPAVDAERILDGSSDPAPVPQDLVADLPADLGSDPPPVATGYNPCPPKGQPCRALPVGDSLTQGAGSRGGGYRRELFRQAVAHGQSVTFVGSRASGPATLEGVPFPRGHEGYGGYTIQGVGDVLRMNNTIATYKPDIVMLEIGTNNGLRRAGANVAAALAALGALMDQILAADDHLLLIVAQITPNRSEPGLAQIPAFNRGIPALVAARAAAGKHVAIVDIYKFFVADPNWKQAYLAGNDVHPNDAGYDAMGRGWYSALGPLLR